MAEAPLYAGRVPIFPKRVSGRFRRAKWGLMALFLGIYWIVPWLRWHRAEGLPEQFLLIDLAARRFWFGPVAIWSDEFYFVAGLLIMAGLGLFVFTAAAGRVWCGYACPQTVWTDLFVAVERWIEGDRNARIRLHRAPWGGHKIALRSAKWGLWALIALATGGAFVFYFADAPGLLRDLVTGRAPIAAYGAIAFLSATTFVFAGFAREQICIYACPWPRIQAAMMDAGSLTIGYRDWRGEPRGKPETPGTGDCIDCQACVSVCPMGIDIREGQQLACITCGLCIDACDAMMDRLGRPRGLVGYLTLDDEASERGGARARPAWKGLLRPRVLVQAGLWAAVGLALCAALVLRPPAQIALTPERNPLFVPEPDGGVRNIYRVELRNRSDRDESFALSGPPGLSLGLEGADPARVTVPAQSVRALRLYLDAGPGSAEASGGQRSGVRITAERSDGRPFSAETLFNGRGQTQGGTDD